MRELALARTLCFLVRFRVLGVVFLVSCDDSFGIIALDMLGR